MVRAIQIVADDFNADVELVQSSWIYGGEQVPTYCYVGWMIVKWGFVVGSVGWLVCRICAATFRVR